MNNAIHVLNTCLTLSMLWTFWHFGWRRFALDKLRQTLFTIRGNLFDYALEKNNGLQFDSPAYVSSWEMLNARIRFAHRITFIHIVIAIVASRVPLFGLKQAIRSYRPDCDVKIDALKNASVKAQMQVFQKQINESMLKYLLMTSPVLLFYTAASFLSALFIVLVQHGYRKAFRRAVGRVTDKEIRKAFRRAVGRVTDKEIKQSVRAVSYQADILEPSIQPCLA